MPADIHESLFNLLLSSLSHVGISENITQVSEVLHYHVLLLLLRSPLFLMLLLLYPPGTDLGLKQHECPRIEFSCEDFADLILWVCVYLWVRLVCLVVIIWV